MCEVVFGQKLSQTTENFTNTGNLGSCSKYSSFRSLFPARTEYHLNGLFCSKESLQGYIELVIHTFILLKAKDNHDQR